MNQINENIYNYSIIGEDYIHLSPDKSKFTLAIFNLFGTLIWGENGKIASYENIVLSSPYIKENLLNLNSKGYCICIMEQYLKNGLDRMRQVIDIFYLALQNKISIHCFFYYKYEPQTIMDALLKFFQPKYKKFGKQSFYCGDDLGKKSIYPWYRKNNNDGELAKSLGLPIYEPNSIIGRYKNNLYLPNTLYITCGQEYAGMEIELEGYRDRKQRGEYSFRYKYKNDIHLYVLTKEDFDLITMIHIQPNESFIVFGNHSTFLEREKIRSKFCGYYSSYILWYAIYPYKKSKSYSNYIETFQNPLQYGELYLRMN